MSIDSVTRRFNFECLSDEDDVENGCEISMHSFSSSGCDTDDSKHLSPLMEEEDEGPSDRSAFQQPAMTSSPRSLTASCSGNGIRKCSIRSIRNRLNDHSPPYKRIKSLNLAEAPETPRTLLDHCLQDFSYGSLPSVPSKSRSRLSLDATHLSQSDSPREANINPFTTAHNCSLYSTDSGISTHSQRSDVAEDTDVCPRVTDVMRLTQEFVVQQRIGSGEFGEVFRCVHRMDGCVYAIKRSHRPSIAGSALGRNALNEVYAHAVLGKHPYIVRYYSAWCECGHMLIQNEYCTRGSLAALNESHVRAGTRVSESQLRRMVSHVTRGLRYIHALGLCHLDVKPANVFITDSDVMVHETAGTYHSSVAEDSSDDGFVEDDQHPLDVGIMYKIGDFGHVTSISCPQVEEGDSRYLPRELLQEDYSNLTKADMFSLGLTLLECVTLQPLPKNGDAWQSLRDGVLPALPGKCSPHTHSLLTELISADPVCRPSAVDVLHHPFLTAATRSRHVLRRQLLTQRMQNEQLKSRVAQLETTLKRSNRCVGRGTLRSNSNYF